MTLGQRVRNENKLKLGFFSPNCSSGMAVTRAPERWENTWNNNIALAQLADEAGIEFMLPIARWIGYGGETDFHGVVRSAGDAGFYTDRPENAQDEDAKLPGESAHGRAGTV